MKSVQFLHKVLIKWESIQWNLDQTFGLDQKTSEPFLQKPIS